MLDAIEPFRQKFLEVAPYFRPLIFMVIAVVVFVNRSRRGGSGSRAFQLRRKGLDLLLEGKPAEAEKCYREALKPGAEVSDSERVRLLVCLGDSLMDQGRYQEAEQCVMQALALGDPSGSGQGSMADVLILEKKDPEKAIEVADQALQLVTHPVNHRFGDAWSAVNNALYEAKTWARKSQALAQLDRRTEARQAIDRAIKIVDAEKGQLAVTVPKTNLIAELVLGDRLRRMKELTISDTHWQISQALLALQDAKAAAEHLRVVRDTDRVGKYRNLANAALERLGAWAV